MIGLLLERHKEIKISESIEDISIEDNLIYQKQQKDLSTSEVN